MKRIVPMVFLIGWALFLGVSPAMAQEGQKIAVPLPGPSAIPPDSPDYRIGPEDVLYIHTWKEESLSRTVPVRMDGKISLPLIDEIQAAGRTPLELKEVLTQKFKEFIDLPNVSVMVLEANSYKVYISGQVRTPGVFRLRSETTLLQIIPMAGGFTEWADQKKILIIRRVKGEEKRIIVNYKKIIEGQESDSNYVLQPGDTIVVP